MVYAGKKTPDKQKTRTTTTEQTARYSRISGKMLPRKKYWYGTKYGTKDCSEPTNPPHYS